MASCCSALASCCSALLSCSARLPGCPWLMRCSGPRCCAALFGSGALPQHVLLPHLLPPPRHASLSCLASLVRRGFWPRFTAAPRHISLLPCRVLFCDTLFWSDTLPHTVLCFHALPRHALMRRYAALCCCAAAGWPGQSLLQCFPIPERTLSRPLPGGRHNLPPCGLAALGLSLFISTGRNRHLHDLSLSHRLPIPVSIEHVGGHLSPASALGMAGRARHHALLPLRRIFCGGHLFFRKTPVITRPGIRDKSVVPSRPAAIGLATLCHPTDV